MVEGLRGLAELSRLDSEIALRIEKREALPARRAACVKRHGECEARLSAARASLEEIGLSQRRQEGLARDQEALLQKLEGQQHQVKSNEAYTALLHEMEAAKDAISAAETEVLEAMEALDRGLSEVGGAEAQFASAIQEGETELAAIEELERGLDEQIAGLERDREQVAGGIEASVRTRYERVARRRRPAIAVVSGETCSGCRVGIPPQNYLEIRIGESLISCGQCNRILIHEVHLR